MRFCVVGKHPVISRFEIERYCDGKWLIEHHGAFVFFELPWYTDEQILECLSTLGGSVKRGKVHRSDNVESVLKGVTLLGCNDSDQAMARKREYKLKRFKYVPLEHTDEEIKREGKECLVIDEERIGEVLWYQDIPRFTAIDFEKPVNGMEVGMMPAKLAQLLINCAVKGTFRNKKSIPTVYDPFCGFGTTLRLANSQGYHGVWSDSTITSAKQNLVRRKTTPYFHDSVYLTLFKHDVYEPIQKPFLKNVTAIATEGWLGPVISSQRAKQRTQGKDKQWLETVLNEINQLYTAAVMMVVQHCPQASVALTYPQYSFLDFDMSEAFQSFAQQQWYTCTALPEVYARPGQYVQRRIVILDPQTIS